jgi:hypothetical protein
MMKSALLSHATIAVAAVIAASTIGAADATPVPCNDTNCDPNPPRPILPERFTFQMMGYCTQDANGFCLLKTGEKLWAAPTRYTGWVYISFVNKFMFREENMIPFQGRSNSRGSSAISFLLPNPDGSYNYTEQFTTQDSTDGKLKCTIAQLPAGAISQQPDFLKNATYVGITEYRGQPVHEFDSTGTVFEKAFIRLDGSWVALMANSVGLEFVTQPIPLAAPDEEVFAPYEMDCS